MPRKKKIPPAVAENNHFEKRSPAGSHGFRSRYLTINDLPLRLSKSNRVFLSSTENNPASRFEPRNQRREVGEVKKNWGVVEFSGQSIALILELSTVSKRVPAKLIDRMTRRQTKCLAHRGAAASCVSCQSATTARIFHMRTNNLANKSTQKKNSDQFSNSFQKHP